ncbi:MAG: hypothetical protein F4052_02890 [Dehalococcoidia bacterium]|nr:hypothetical protein [Dehalococcoidia bacterium]MYK25888.1 hypothetical protein [Dehalococcoidia bacterium]
MSQPGWEWWRARPCRCRPRGPPARTRSARRPRSRGCCSSRALPRCPRPRASSAPAPPAGACNSARPPRWERRCTTPRRR